MIFFKDLNNTAAGGPAYTSSPYAAGGPWQLTIAGVFDRAQVVLEVTTATGIMATESFNGPGMYTVQTDAGASCVLQVYDLTDNDLISATSEGSSV